MSGQEVRGTRSALTKAAIWEDFLAFFFFFKSLPERASFETLKENECIKKRNISKIAVVSLPLLSRGLEDVCKTFPICKKKEKHFDLW